MLLSEHCVHCVAFWHIIEGDLEIEVPPFIKNLLLLAGFDSASTIESMEVTEDMYRTIWEK